MSNQKICKSLCGQMDGWMDKQSDQKLYAPDLLMTKKKPVKGSTTM